MYSFPCLYSYNTIMDILNKYSCVYALLAVDYNLIISKGINYSNIPKYLPHQQLLFYLIFIYDL